MKLIRIFSTCAATLTIAAEELLAATLSNTVYAQAIGSIGIFPLAKVQYDSSTLDAELISYDSPGLDPGVKLVRLGIYDSVEKLWSSSTTVTSAESFSKGYLPTIVITIDLQGDILSVSCESAAIDAGQTRDFGPKVNVVRTVEGKAPELNKPVVLKEGVVEGEVPEKTLLQR